MPPIPIDMRSLIEAGDRPLQATRTVHDALVTSKAAGEFVEREGSRRVFYPPSAVDYLPVVPDPSKVMSLAGAYQRRAPDGTPGRYDDVEYPSFFFKSPASLTGHETDINLRGLLTTGVHEPELLNRLEGVHRQVEGLRREDWSVSKTISLWLRGNRPSTFTPNTGSPEPSTTTPSNCTARSSLMVGQVIACVASIVGDLPSRRGIT